jgi:hypothetical protein
MRLSHVLAITGVIALLVSASPSAVAATGAAATSAGAWTATKAPLPANADHTYAQLNSVACPAASTCTAVGSYTGSAGMRGLLLTKSGTTWTARQAPLPAGAAADPFAALESINCFSASVCAAIGNYTDSSGNTQWLLLTTSGSSWTAAKAPVPPDAASDPGTGLSAVHCASTTSCVAVGSYEDSAGDFEGLLITGFGKHWTATQAPVPSNAQADPYADLQAVTCTATNHDCVIVGRYYGPSPADDGLLITGSGSSWTATEAPLPGNAGTDPYADLSAVRCLSPSSCTAVGSYDDASYDEYGLLVTGSGTSWTATQAPRPPNANQTYPDSWLSAVTCPGSSACIAAGGYYTTGGADAAMLVTVSGSSLTVSQATLPGNAAMNSNPDLGAVACASASACVATGDYRIASGHDRGLLVYGGGTSWTAIQAPVPKNSGVNADIPAVSCPKKSSNCIAVGYYVKAGNDQGLLLTGPA